MRRHPAVHHSLHAIGAVCVILAFHASPAVSQTDSRLVEIIRQAQEGRGDSARIKVQRMLASTPSTDSLYPQIVYTQAMVSSDAGEMRRQLQRVAVEFPASSWADDALLRLVQLDFASGNLAGAARNLERIRQDYPGSPLLPQAAYWAARTYFDQKNPALACRWLAQGMAASTGNVELQNQLGYLNQRCSNLPPDSGAIAARDSQPTNIASGTDTVRPTQPATTPMNTPALPPVAPTPPRPDSARADTVPPRTTATRSAHFRIQVTAVRTASAAEASAARIKARGYPVVTVQEGGLYKVRVGSYATRGEAVAAVPDIKAKLGGSPFVVAEP
jgi:cell division septation protein DedD